ncbi:hypothetical protein QBC36DRAFT_340843 [Triangularia setosa]|uniref:Uncharacterized protein n=1 Tax=Triangularia setosa TaxID=2587417 RepID=A0AAN6VYA7_9PEZI|nr:hypothetical protein QBC36DRAFT_340843 [Podospora setosa]
MLERGAPRAFLPPCQRRPARISSRQSPAIYNEPVDFAHSLVRNQHLDFRATPVNSSTSPFVPPSGALGNYGEVMQATIELRGHIILVRYTTRITLRRNFDVGPSIIGYGGEQVGVANFDTSFPPLDKLFIHLGHVGVSDRKYGGYYSEGLVLSPAGTEKDTLIRVGCVNMERGHGEG